MKKIYLIGGTMGVGKTSVCQYLKKELSNCVFLDGDWCWDSFPFVVNEETKTMVIDNIVYLLNNFIHCSAYEHILFCWVMHEQSIIDMIIKKLDTRDCDVCSYSLIADESCLKERLEKDIDEGKRSEDILERSLERLPLYEKLSTIKIDTSHKSLSMIADEIIQKANHVMIRLYREEDLTDVAVLFYECVHTVNAKDYTQEQLDAWADGKIDLEKWNQSFLKHISYVALKDGKIVGFGDIDPSGYLDRLYVHKDYQHQKIATLLCQQLERCVHVPKIVVHASITARPFFEKRGYHIIKKQQVERKKILLTNYVMEKLMF